MTFVNFMSEDVSVANYIEPGVANSDDMTKFVTMSRFVDGYENHELPPNQPWTWITDEKFVRHLGKTWSDFRTRSIEFTRQNPEGYARMPLWSEMWGGQEGELTPLDIPITPETFGITHGDPHNGNYLSFLDDEGNYVTNIIDFDNSERCWFMSDVGTIMWGARMQFWLHGKNGDKFEEEYANFQTWFFDEYAYPTT